MKIWLGTPAILMFSIWACSGSDRPGAFGTGNFAGESTLGGKAGTTGGANSGGTKSGGASGMMSIAGMSGAPAGGSAEAGGRASGGNLGAAGDLSAGGEPGTGLAGSGGGPTIAPTCSPTATWTNSVGVDSVNSGAKEILLDITHDELTIAWLKNDSQLHIADRTLPSDGFGNSHQVSVPNGYDPALGVALSADGLRLVLVATAGAGFAELTRATRSGNFDPTPSTAMFDTLNILPGTAGQSFRAPVLHAADNSLFYVGTMQVSSVYMSSRNGQSWGIGSLIGEGLLEGTQGNPNVLSAVSDDQLTFFYFNQAKGIQEARFRETSNSPLYDVVGFAQMKDARPNSACTHLYYSKGDSGNGDIYFAVRD
ncbi:MAG: hypothetical protein SFV15_26520 [Polyangiaceae bacterium]|nr:hypothetical protein [Polyangiaceae bacterium]